MTNQNSSSHKSVEQLGEIVGAFESLTTPVTAELLGNTLVEAGMATLNLSTNGPSISKSYQSVVNASLPSNSAAKSATYAQWVIYSVSAPLVNAFQQDSVSKESVLKVQNTGGK